MNSFEDLSSRKLASSFSFSRMNSYLLSQYDRLCNGLGIVELEDEYALEEDLLRSIDRVPKAYFIGLAPSAIPLLTSVADEMHLLTPDLVIDVGSGKGHLGRLMANYYDYRTVCVDAIKDRLKATIRWDRLLNSSNVCEDDVFVSDRAARSAVSNNIKTLNLRLSSQNDFNKAMQESLQWGNVGGQCGKIAIVALKVCGDMIYNLMDWCSGRCLDATLTLVIIPCCFHLSERYPQSTKLKGVSSSVSPAPNTMHLLDMLLYAQEVGFVVETKSHYGNYFSFKMTLNS